MTTLVAIDDGLDMRDFDLEQVLDYVDVYSGETSLTFYVWAQYWLNIFGKGFEYGDGGVPTNGTVTALDGMDIHGSEYLMSDFEYDLKKLYKIAVSGPVADDTALLKDIFSGDDKITGGSGSDLAKGFNGSDKLLGKRGYDTLSGGPGDDILIGGHDQDSLWGSAGADVFAFHAADSNLKHSDTIHDFSRHEGDTIDLSAIGHLSFIGDHKFHREPMELRAETHASVTIVQADLNGDGEADLQVYLSGKITIKEADFVL